MHVLRSFIFELIIITGVACCEIFAHQKFEQFFIRIMIAALVDDSSRALEKSSIYNGGENTIRSNPSVGVIDDTTLFQLVRDAIEDVIADVFLVGQNLMD